MCQKNTLLYNANTRANTVYIMINAFDLSLSCFKLNIVLNIRVPNLISLTRLHSIAQLYYLLRFRGYKLRLNQLKLDANTHYMVIFLRQIPNNLSLVYRIHMSQILYPKCSHFNTTICPDIPFRLCCSRLNPQCIIDTSICKLAIYACVEYFLNQFQRICS